VLERLRAAVRRLTREDRIDLALVAAMLAASAAEFAIGVFASGDRAADLAWAAAVLLPLTVRRRFPAAVWLVVLAVMDLQAAVSDSADGIALFLGLLVGGYTVGAYLPRRRAAACLVVLVPAMAFASWRSTGNPWDDLVFAVLLVGSCWVAGRVVWSRSRLVEQLAGQSEELRRTRDAAARALAAEQRERIARDVHDVVAHSVSLMVVQAEAGEARLPEGAPSAENLRAIQRVGRSTLTELRGLLATLGEDMDTASEGARTPAPRVRDADLLVAELEQAGLKVDLLVAGPVDALPAGVDLAAYRILQEALTNALRHGQGPVRARVEVDGSAVVVDVLDGGDCGDGGDGPERGVDGAGRGLVGMRERARLFGGDVDCGPTPDGFRVRARLPVPVTAVTP
jgi:signal transduction histidine kinase